MGVAELLVVRHGESTGNVAAAAAHAEGLEMIELDRRDADIPLSPLGVEQARALGKGLAQLPAEQTPTRVWCSPYLRAEQTARTALEAAGLDLPLRIDERLRDRELGVLDLLTTLGVERRFPDEASRRAWLGKFYHRPAGGESWADLILRVRSVLADLDRAEEGERVLVVCHDALVLCFRYVCERLSEHELMDIGTTTPVRNVSLTRLVQGSDGLSWTLAGFNDVSHLEQQDLPVTAHPGDDRTSDPGKNDPGTSDPGTSDPGTSDPGTDNVEQGHHGE